MCGLAGVARIGGGDLPGDVEDVVRRMTRVLSLRGPDAVALYGDGPVSLGFTRLSIVGVDSGDQPLVSDDGSVALIANGEIYNHRELEAGLPAGTRMSTKSDCEVLVHLYQRDGLDFLKQVRGMYALVVWDRRRNRLLFARDGFGIKPLFYHRAGRHVSFASEIKALFEDPACPRRVDWQRALSDQALTSAPVFGHEPLTTWFEGVEIVPAGTLLEIDLSTGDLRTHVHWSLPVPGENADEGRTDEEFIAGYRELLEESVRECRMSDVEIGLFLSGGVDSAAVAALASRGGQVHTFTALDGSTFVNEDAKYGARVAATFGLPNHQVVFGPNQVPSPREWTNLLWQVETPQCGPEQYYKYEMHRIAKSVAPNLKVMLLGQAADEFNGGYSVELAGGGDWDDFTANLTTMARESALGGHPGLAPWWKHGDFSLLRSNVLDQAGARMLDDPYAAYVAWKYRDIQQYNCWHEDRTAAGNGIEARVPFLDHRLVELTATIPRHRRRDLLWNKRIIRSAMRGVLPEWIRDRPKGPFFYGDGVLHTRRRFVRMLAQDGEALLEQALATPRAREFLDADGIRSTLRHLERDPGAMPVELLLRVVNLGLLDEMCAQPPQLTTAPRAELALSLREVDWDRAASLVVEPRSVDLAAVPALPEEVLLLRASDDPDTWYVAVDGVIEYVVDETEDGDWCRFLRAVDGTRSVAEVLAVAGCPLDSVAATLDQAIEVGVLEILQPVTNEGRAQPALADA